MEEQRDRGQPHEGSITRRAWIRRSRERVAADQVSFECSTGGCSDVKTLARGAEVSPLPPIDIAIHLVGRIKPVPIQKARGETKSHRGVIGPLACLQVERATPNNVPDSLEGAPIREFDRGAQCIAAGKTQ